MKYINLSLLSLLFFSGCTINNQKIVDYNYTDSILKYHAGSESVQRINQEVNFWKGRMNSENPGISNELKYASSLIQRFHLTGNIGDLTEAEKVLHQVDLLYHAKEPQVYLSLTQIALLRHQFKSAQNYLNKAKRLGIENYIANSLSFDVEFELGRYNYASFYLNKLKSPADYGYSFRLAKLAHLNGKADSAVTGMLDASKIAPKKSYLQAVALANAADFSVHMDHPEQAAALYKKSISVNGNDFHSISGLGTLAMKYDQDYQSAERFFNLVKQHYQLPDALYKLYQLGQSRHNKNEERLYAKQFAAAASKPVYGQMYTKYLIELYTGVLDNPTLAEQVAKNELNNRLTPQTAAWYVWTLYNNKKPEKATLVYKKYVSGKPLEGFELYYMGKVMEGLQKAYTSKQYFKAASENKFDLSPAMIEDLETKI